MAMRERLIRQRWQLFLLLMLLLLSVIVESRSGDGCFALSLCSERSRTAFRKIKRRRLKRVGDHFCLAHHPSGSILGRCCGICTLACGCGRRWSMPVRLQEEHIDLRLIRAVIGRRGRRERHGEHGVLQLAASEHRVRIHRRTRCSCARSSRAIITELISCHWSSCSCACLLQPSMDCFILRVIEKRRRHQVSAVREQHWGTSTATSAL